MDELEGRGYSRFNEVPEELFDYLPENMEDEDEEEECLIVDEGRNSPWFVHCI